jgi:hypothetical protein
MKIRNTQKLFWKRWPIKAVIEIASKRQPAGWRLSREGHQERMEELTRVERWCKAHFPDSGIRKETHLSLFLDNEEQLTELLDYYEHKVIEVWKPASEATKELLLTHTYDIVRARPWYGKFPIRARICYTHEFRTVTLPAFKEAVKAIDPNAWHAAGLLKDLIVQDELPKIYGWGQPLHLYLETAEDATILRLTCGDCIERFERIRKP